MARATHNIYAYRIQESGDRIVEHYDDDGEYGAGRRILELLRTNNITNKLICVTRWFGGKKLGPARYQIITDSAKQVIELV